MSSIRIFRRIVVALALVIVASASVSPASIALAQTPQRGGTLIVGLSADPATLNPAITSGFAEHLVAGQMFEALVGYDPNTLKPIPGLADSWDVAADGLTYTFHLTKNATWHDGIKFTSADVKYSFENVIIPYHPRGQAVFGTVLTSITTPDDYTAVFHLKQPSAPMINMLGLWYAGIVPKHIYNGTDVLKNPHNLDNPIGTGPYTFKEWVRADHIILVRNPNFRLQGKPYLDQIIYRVIPDDLQRVRALETGDVMYIPLMVPFSELPRLLNETTIKMVFNANFGAMYLLQFNLQNKYLSNLKVRQAIAYAIDRQFIVKSITFGLEKVAAGPFASSMQWAYASDVPKYGLNKDLANSLLDQAGYPKQSDGWRFTLRINLPRWSTDDVRATEVIRDELRDIGINAQLTVLEIAADNQQIYMKHDFDIHVEPRQSTGPDPSQNAYMYTSKSIRLSNPIPSTWNIMIYNNSKVDQLFDQGVSETNQDKRAEIYKEIQRTIMTDLPMFPIMEQIYPHVFKPTVVGVPADPYGGLRQPLINAYIQTKVTSTTQVTTTVAQTGQDWTTIIEAFIAAIIIIGAGVLLYKRKGKKTTQ